MRISVKIEHKDKEWVSDVQELTENEVSVMEKLLEEIATGNVNYFHMDITHEKRETVYFGIEILSHSILTLIHH